MHNAARGLDALQRRKGSAEHGRLPRGVAWPAKGATQRILDGGDPGRADRLRQRGNGS
jgi:hypothetical protein